MNDDILNRRAINARTLTIETHTRRISEGDINLNLTIVDTPGYGDHINNRDAWKPILKYVEDQKKLYLEREMDINRVAGPVEDPRVHACLYFIAAHRLKMVTPSGPFFSFSFS